MNTGDTALVLMSTVLVFAMTVPGLAFFYGGLVRRKNVLSILMQCFIIMCVISLQWALCGYSLSFGPDTGKGIIGSLKWAGLNYVGGQPNADYAATIPHAVFMIFQCMFAVITTALMIGAFAERMKFSAFLVFTILWATFVYDPLAHWVWGTGGWMRSLGGLDFAGGIVVHASSGVSALVLCVMLGKRLGYKKTPFRPHNLPFTVLGGQCCGSDGSVSMPGPPWPPTIWRPTPLSPPTSPPQQRDLPGRLSSWRQHGKPTILGTVTGAVAGLVAITPACGFVNPMNAIFIGIIVACVCYLAVAVLKAKLGYDDALDAFGVHGVGGIWGTIAVGLFAEKAVNSAGANGLFFGGAQLWPQFIMAVVTPLFAGVMTLIIYKLVDAIMCVRVKEKDETIGLDLTQQSEAAYTVIE